MFPDFSGKYHGKLNDKISRKTAEKISKMQLQEKRLKQRNYQNLKGKHNGKIRVKTCAKTWVMVRHIKSHESSFCTKKPSPTR